MLEVWALGQFSDHECSCVHCNLFRMETVPAGCHFVRFRPPGASSGKEGSGFITFREGRQRYCPHQQEGCETITLQSARNGVIHRGKKVRTGAASLAVAVAATLLNRIFPSVLTHLDLHLHDPGVVCNQKHTTTLPVTLTIPGTPRPPFRAILARTGRRRSLWFRAAS